MLAFQFLLFFPGIFFCTLLSYFLECVAASLCAHVLLWLQTFCGELTLTELYDAYPTLKLFAYSDTSQIPHINRTTASHSLL